MKTKQGLLAIIFAFLIPLLASQVSAASLHEETATFKVYGNCDMCKKRIETALLKNSNIKKANWDSKTKMLTITYDPHSINLDAIHTIVANAGHDTDKVKASDATYNSLPGCCQYQRRK